MYTREVCCITLRHNREDSMEEVVELGGYELSVHVLDGKTYLTLPMHDEFSKRHDARCNFSSCRQIHSITTIWHRIRIDLVTLKVHTTDTTFASTDGHWAQASPANCIPYASCYACDGRNLDLGRCNIDLRGTPFIVASNFRPGGCFACVVRCLYLHAPDSVIEGRALCCHCVPRLGFPVLIVTQSWKCEGVAPRSGRLADWRRPLRLELHGGGD